jgi:hypothetical protein
MRRDPLRHDPTELVAIDGQRRAPRDAGPIRQFQQDAPE